MPLSPSYDISISLNPPKGILVLWIDGKPLALNVGQAKILECLLREARLAVEAGSGKEEPSVIVPDPAERRERHP